MAREFLIIDGYNLMHAAGLARARYGPGDLARRRHRLLRFLQSVLPDELRRRTTIVFDAWEPPPEGTAIEMVADMTVQFATAPGEADAVIEDLIAGHSAPKQLTVVSGDRRLQLAATRRKARSVDSEAWYAQWEGRQEVAEDPLPPSPKQSPDLSDQELEYWMDVFGDIDETQGGQRDNAWQDLPDVIDEEDFDQRRPRIVHPPRAISNCDAGPNGGGTTSTACASGGDDDGGGGALDNGASRLSSRPTVRRLLVAS